jgi:hypothetical protein
LILDESGFPSAVNNTFLSFRIRDKKAAGTKCVVKRAAVLSIFVTVVLLGIEVIAEAQQPKKVPRIGYLSGGSPSSESPMREAFRQGLRDLGYVDGQNVAIEERFGNVEQYAALTADSSISKLTSLSWEVGQRLWLPRTQPRPFPL